MFDESREHVAEQIDLSLRENGAYLAHAFPVGKHLLVHIKGVVLSYYIQNMLTTCTNVHKHTQKLNFRYSTWILM